MEKVDWAIIISILSFLAAGASAFYARRLAIQDAAKMKRKRPILEVDRCNALSEYKNGQHVVRDGYWSATVAIRNLEPTAQLRLLAITSKSKCIALYEDISDDSSSIIEPRELKRVIDDAVFRHKISLGSALAVHGTSYLHTSPHRYTDTWHGAIYSKSQITSKDLTLEWEWMDGQKK